MHIKNIHCMVEKLSECAKCEVEKGIEQLNTEEMGAVTDMLKDLCEAEYYARIAKAMEKSEEEDEAEEKYIRKMLKEENKDEYKRMREEYGEEDGERRFYDNYRYANGRFAPKGRGSYEPRRSGRRGRRGYTEEPIPFEYIMDAESYNMYPPEYWRDMDRSSGRMYYTSPETVSAHGERISHRNPVAVYGDRPEADRDGKEGKSGRSRRTYMETKELHKDGSTESKQQRMKELDTYMNELNEDMKELISDMSPEERAMVKQKVAKLAAIV